MKNKFTSICFMLATSISISMSAQSPSLDWVTGITSPDEAYAGTLCSDQNGNVISTGLFYGTIDADPGVGSIPLTAANLDVYILKQDKNGDAIWAKQISGNSSFEFYTQQIRTDAAGNIYVLATFLGSADFDPGPGVVTLTAALNDIAILKLDPNGNLLWAKAISNPTNDNATGLAVYSSGIYVTGVFSSTIDIDPGTGVFNLTGNGGADLFVLKLDLTGNFIWAKSIGGTGGDATNACAADANGNVFITGLFSNTVDFDPGTGVDLHSSLYGNDLFVAKLDASGNYSWAKTFEGTGQSDWGNACVTDATGNIYVAGFYSDTIDFDPGPGTNQFIAVGGPDIFAMKLSTSGNMVWVGSMGSIAYDAANAMDIDAAGNIYLSGTISATADMNPSTSVADSVYVPLQTPTYYIASLDQNGNFRFANGFPNGFDPSYAFDITVDPFYNIYTTGELAANPVVDFDPGAAVFNLNLPYYGTFVHKLNQCSLLPINNATTTNQYVITATQTGVAYQWINCSSGQPIAGETNQSFTATVDGDYAVILRNASCVDTSACVTILGIGIHEAAGAATVHIFPNPSNGIFFVQGLDRKHELEVFNASGQRILYQTAATTTAIDLSAEANGIYFIRIVTADGVQMVKVCKE